ncbi:ornithine cyclodeaminase [Lysinibacillus alkalisoli]|uniref:Ornithine cyclodeaminase n=1 Tax=Lysinibacillus alkalisoli TaxID=1911548 RepID=A0A917G2N8_9BACI|nr:ornithine cyclodeaminase family protein [Lysinibacillus alkalisoli]GGG19997.1 ornithine cyclodeaminase [Lysinibacillus alkalisoli]
MLVFNQSIIQKHYGMADAIDDVKKTLRAKKNGLIDAPERTVVNVEEYDASALYMPCLNLDSKMAAMKVVSIFPTNATKNLPTTQGAMLLTEMESGQHIALMNASYLTRLRTGAQSAIATDRFAKKDADTLAVIGTGGMAFEQVLGINEVRDLTTIYLYNRTKEKAFTFKERLEHFGVKATIIVVDSAAEATTQAQIINCATRSTESVILKSDVQAGTHINGVGSYLPEMREIDTALITNEQQIIVDDVEGFKHEAGEFIAAVKQGTWSFDNIFASLEDVVTDESLTRRDDNVITIFKSVGASYYDLAVAEGTYRVVKPYGETITVE